MDDEESSEELFRRSENSFDTDEALRLYSAALIKEREESETGMH